MKKLLLPLLTFAAFNFGTAQEESISFGAKAGVNLANFVGDGDEFFDSKIGFNVGAVVEIPISEKFAVQPEVLFSTQGTKFKFDEILDDIETKVKLNYINIPVMAKYYVAEGFSLQAGPQLGILVSAESESGDEDQDIKDDINSIDFGLNFGAGYQLEFGLFFDARYNLGLSNLNDDDDDDADGIEFKNSVFSISVGYKF